MTSYNQVNTAYSSNELLKAYGVKQLIIATVHKILLYKQSQLKSTSLSELYIIAQNELA